MPLPDIQDISRPILEALRDGDPHNLTVNDLVNIAAEHFGLGELSTNDRNTFKQTVTQAKNDLKKRKLIANPSNNTYIITSAGLNYLNELNESSDETEQTVIIPEETQNIYEPEMSQKRLQTFLNLSNFQMIFLIYRLNLKTNLKRLKKIKRKFSQNTMI